MLVRLVELEAALQRGIDPRQLGDCAPVLAGGIEITEPADRVREQMVDVSAADGAEFGHKFVIR